MPSIRLTQFAGLMPELSAKLKRKDNAQIAHNCLLYDGKLRAMPAYFQYGTLPQTPLSLYRTPSNGFNGRVTADYELYQALYYDGAPFPQCITGISFESLNNYPAFKFGSYGVSGTVLPAGMGLPDILSGPTFNIIPGHLAQRPSVASYAVTFTRTSGLTVQESPPIYLGTVGQQDSGSVWFEGDAVQINCTFSTLLNGQTGVRLYRSITALESGEQLVNTFDTDWFLLVSFPIDPTNPVLTYTDNIVSQNLPGDLLLSKTFFPPLYTGAAQFYGNTESGWTWFATQNEIQFSERYMVHAWPPANYIKTPEADQYQDVKSFYDTVFIGTSGKPYRVKIQPSNDETIDVNAYPYPEHQPCISNTMVTAPFGALYTSVNGVVSLEENKLQVITRDLLNGGETLYRQCVDGTENTFRYQDISYAAWFNGWYIGYSAAGIAFIYQPPEDLNAVHPFQQLVTMDSPIQDIPSAYALGDYGLQIAFGTGLYYLPIPGWVRSGDTPQKLCYRWKSKKFVFPGLTTFAAMKVVWECDGEVCIKLIGDCRHIYERKVSNCNPFRLPHNWRHIEFEIEVTGTGTVSEIHVASSMQELTEVNTE